MLNNLLIHRKTRQNAQAFISNPSQSLLITGEVGSGKDQIAKSISSEILNVDEEKLEAYPYFYVVSKLEGQQNISIGQIRQLVHFLRLKVPGKSANKRLILVKDANYMNEEAQNALLKALEEPNPDTVFILTANSESSLRPTIVSRAQRLVVFPVSLVDAKKYFGGFLEASVESYWQLSGGAAALLSALLNQKDHVLKAQIENAKAFIKLSPYGRLIKLSKIKSKAEFLDFLGALSKILNALHRKATIGDKTKQSQQILSDRKSIYQAANSVESNVSPRATGLWLALNLKV